MLKFLKSAKWLRFVSGVYIANLWILMPIQAQQRAVYLEPYTEYNRKMDKGEVRELSESAWFPIWLADIYTGYMDPLAIEYQQGGEILTNEADDLYNRIFS